MPLPEALNPTQWLAEATFALRNRIRFSRSGYRETGQSCEHLFDAVPALSHAEAELLTRYPAMRRLQAHADPLRYRENLNLLTALDQLLPAEVLSEAVIAPSIRVLEVGIKNWGTLDALMAFLDGHGLSPDAIDGVELDLWRLYANLHSRYDIAAYHAAQYPAARIIAGNALNLAGTYDVIAIFLPFLFASPHSAWGLPVRYFNPDAYFDHVINRLLRPGGLLVLTNQGEWEDEAQAQQLARFPMIIRTHRVLDQPFYPLRYPRYGWCAQKH